MIWDKHETPRLHCSEKDCTAWIKDHAWGHIKADDWFFQKDGKAFCPDHIPEWVEAWRTNKKESTNG